MANFQIKPFLSRKTGLPESFSAEVLGETEKARKIKHPTSGEDCWVAKSQTISFSDGTSAPVSVHGGSMCAQVANMARCVAARLLEQNEGYDGEIDAQRLLELTAKEILRSPSAPAPAPVAPARVENPYVQPGEKFEIKAWLARRLAEEKGMPFFFRNLECVEFHRETSKAVEVTVSFVSTVATSCHCCGKPLDTEVSRATGIGPVCAKKYLHIDRPSIENARETLARIEEEARSAGHLKIWVPKSQIKSTSPATAGEVVELKQPAKDESFMSALGSL